MGAMSLIAKIGAVAVVVAAAASAASVELKDAGTWSQTEYNEGTYSTYSLNAWFDVQTSEDPGQTINKVFINIRSLYENFSVADSFGVYAFKHGYDASTKKHLWHAEVRINDYYLWGFRPAEIEFSIKADIGQQYGSIEYLYDLQNPHYLLQPMNAQTPVRFLPNTLQVQFEDAVGPVVTGVVRVWDPQPEQLNQASVELRYSVDGWKTVQSVKAARNSGASGSGSPNEFQFRVDKLTKSADVSDFVEKLEFAVRFVNSQGIEFWDNNNKQNYVQRLLPEILAPTVFGELPLSGEVEINFNVLLDTKFSTASVKQISPAASSSEASNSLSVVVDTSLLSNGATAKFLVKAVAFATTIVEKTFEFKVFNALKKEAILLPEAASHYWTLARSAENSSQLILSSFGNYLSSNQFVVFDKDSETLVESGKFGQGLTGQLLVDNSDAENVYVFNQNSLTKVSKADLSTVAYKIDLGSLQFCNPKAAAFSSKFALVLDSCGGKLEVFDKSSGALKATISQTEGLEEQYLGDVVVDKENDAIYVFAASAVQLLNGSSLKIEKTWTGDFFPRAVALSGDGLFYISGGEGAVEAVRLTDDLKVKSLGKFPYQSGRVVAGIVGLPEEDAALVVDVQKNQLLKFSLAESTPLIM